MLAEPWLFYAQSFFCGSDLQMQGGSRQVIRVWLALLLASHYSIALRAESICVKHGQCPMKLSSEVFECPEITESSFVRRVCYDKDKSFMVINLRGTWYPYCGVDAISFEQLLSAP